MTAAVGLLLGWAAPAVAQESGAYAIQTDASRFRVEVGKSGLFRAFGHEHLIEVRRYTGEVRFDQRSPASSSVTLEIEGASLTVVDPDVKPDERAKIQAQMESEALETGKFPTIRFESTKLSLDRVDGGLRGTLEGSLTLHGVTRAVKMPVEIFGAMSKLGARGETRIKGSDYGVKQVTAAGGAVKTKDEIKLTFDLVCEKKP